ncbi:MAG: HPr family phosphocarrier protein [Candidatus Zophobacter franzmannii]|nr:HPr family phosphocarrier protein [Candidatus Zophobacter franzmannii]
MITKDVSVSNKLGLHTRPSALLVKTATKYRSELMIIKDGMEINGKSIMGVMMLAAEFNSLITLQADGVDEEYLMNDLLELFETKFGEE